MDIDRLKACSRVVVSVATYLIGRGGGATHRSSQRLLAELVLVTVYRSPMQVPMGSSVLLCAACDTCVNVFVCVPLPLADMSTVAGSTHVRTRFLLQSGQEYLSDFMTQIK